ncbi:MAG: hypothetical protein ABH840_02110, partial [Nanoarchaeota archaeon]
MDVNGTKEVAGGIFREVYGSVINSVPEQYMPFFSLGFYVIMIAIYAVFIWKFYRFLAKRDVFDLDLSKYNQGEHPGVKMFFAVLFFFLEYIIILPFLILFWFGIFSLFLLMLAKHQGLTQITLIAAAIIGATRISSYISEDLSKDLAKMLPFTLLGIFLIDPSFFSVDEFISRLYEIPSLFENILFYLVFIFALEIILRGVFTIIDVIWKREESNSEEGRVLTA